MNAPDERDGNERGRGNPEQAPTGLAKGWKKGLRKGNGTEQSGFELTPKDVQVQELERGNQRPAPRC